MASSIFMKRSSNLIMDTLLKPLRPCAVAAPSISRSLNMGALFRESDDDSGIMERPRPQADVRPPNFFSDVVYPSSPTRSLSQVLNMMDQLMDNPFRALSQEGSGWDAREDKDALYLKIDMPGLGKDDVKVCVEQDTLIIKGKGGQEGEESVRTYSSRIDLAPQVYKFDEIKAEMKNGVLKVLVPKVKETERKDVRQVQVE